MHVRIVAFRWGAVAARFANGRLWWVTDRLFVAGWGGHRWPSWLLEKYGCAMRKQTDCGKQRHIPLLESQRRCVLDAPHLSRVRGTVCVKSNPTRGHILESPGKPSDAIRNVQGSHKLPK